MLIDEHGYRMLRIFSFEFDEEGILTFLRFFNIQVINEISMLAIFSFGRSVIGFH